MTEVQDYVADPVVTKSLGEPTAALVTAMACDYFVPNLAHGMVTMPRGHDRPDGLPVVATYVREEICLSQDFAALNRTQELGTYAALDALGVSFDDAETCVADTEQAFTAAARRDPFSYSLASLKAQAAVAAIYYEVDLGCISKRVRLESLPVMILGMRRHGRRVAATPPPSSTLHEIIHGVGQNTALLPEVLDRAYDYQQYQFEKETVAYDAEAAAIQSRSAAGWPMSESDLFALRMQAVIGHARDIAHVTKSDPMHVFDSLRKQAA